VEIREREIGMVTVIDFKLDANDRGGYDGLRQIVRERLDAGRLKFVINLAECHSIDSLGLGELIRSFVHVMRQGGNLKLAGVSIKIKGLLAITKLNQVFEIYDDVDSAIASFR